MQKSSQNATSSFFSSFSFGSTKSRPGTSSGDTQQQQQQQQQHQQQQHQLHSSPSTGQLSASFSLHKRSNSNAPSPNPDFATPEFPPELAASASASALNLQLLAVADNPRDRRPSFSRKASFSSPGKNKRRLSLGYIAAPDTAPPPLPDLAGAVASHFANSSNNNSNSHNNNNNHNANPKGALTPLSVSAVGAGSSQIGDAHSPLIPHEFPALSRTHTGTTVTTPSSSGYGGFMSAYTALLPAPPGVDGGIHGNIADLARKRINTLDYLRKAHEGRIFWFNTYQMERPDVSRMSAAAASRFARRATNFLLLGVSLPTVIDLAGTTPLEYLRAFNTLLAEFETFSQLHGDSSSTSSLSRARLPQMFRRPGGRRRSSATTDLQYDGGMDAGSGGAGPAATSNAAAFAAAEADLFPGESYTTLLTPSLPFDPDFHETFATLCDVLIVCYQKLLGLIPTNKECTPPVAEQFAKADGRVRKIILQGSIKEFDEAVRSNVRVEVANLNKIVLSGLM